MTITTITATVFAPLTEGDYHARLARTQGLAVVLFSHVHCGSCRVWKCLLPEALSTTVQHFFEVDVALDTGAARYFGIFHLPTIYLYRHGQFHAELQCEAGIDVIQRTTRALFDLPAQEEP